MRFLFILLLCLPACLPASQEPRLTTIDLFLPAQIWGTLPFSDRQKQELFAEALTSNTVLRLVQTVPFKTFQPEVQVLASRAVYQVDGSRAAPKLQAGFELTLRLPEKQGLVTLTNETNNKTRTVTIQSRS